MANWFLGGLILIALGLALRRLLRLARRSTEQGTAARPLSADREALYDPLAREVRAHGAILGISLNDAIEEHGAGHEEVAWRMTTLAFTEWNRSARLVTALLEGMARRLPEVAVLVPIRTLVTHRFRSPLMADFVRIYELLDQVLFRSKLRFQLHLHVLRRATATLTGEFRRTFRYADRTGDHSPEVWKRLDLYSHDFDLVSKEALFAFRTFLTCLPDAMLGEFAADVREVLRHEARAASVAAIRR